MIKVIIFDGDGTLQLPNPSNEIRNLVALLPSLGIKMAIASNNDRSAIEKGFRQAGLLLPEIIVTRNETGVPKPSPEFIKRIREHTEVELNEIMYVGDDDKTDTFCAINAGVLPVAAKYSNSGKPMDYGLPINTPDALERYITKFTRQEEPYWGWVCQSKNSRIDVRALFGDHGNFTDILKSILKDQKDSIIGSRKVSATELFFRYFMSQFYLSGVAAQTNIITVYPGHTAGKQNHILNTYLSRISKMFRKDKFLQDLIVRHQNAPKSQFQGPARNIFDQFKTIHINPEYKSKIQGKTILVLDDFTTSGYSLETARNMLLQAGARKIICLAIAKYRNSYSVAQVTKEWNSFIPCTLEQEDVKTFELSGTINRRADEYFNNSIWNYYSH